jgi:hypothetical protein
MEIRSQVEDEGNGLNRRRGWNVVVLARWAGVAVLASAVGLAIWTWVDFPGELLEGGDRFRARLAWQTLVQLGWGGVVIILLAELVDRLTSEDDQYDDDGTQQQG